MNQSSSESLFVKSCQAIFNPFRTVVHVILITTSSNENDTSSLITTCTTDWN